ncbi:MAG TPA: hypothetical protein ENN21_06100 [Spirochaetes bacterium]|nr:hypothetical protein [Spirochaetota bacterium]
MTVKEKITPPGRAISLIAALVFASVSIGAVITASRIQRDFGRVEVGDVWYQNYNGIPIRAKLFRPVEASAQNRLPGVVYIHGYQNNRETGDAYSIETARRGFVVLNIDAIGRGHSGIPGGINSPDFDHTYGGKSSVDYLRKQPFVDPGAVGIMGHSLGAEMAYKAALADPGIRALVITGFAYTLESTVSTPKNMLMIIGQYDEFRKRMTGTRDIRKEWMGTERTAKTFPVKNPELGKTYGDFSRGTARRVYVPPIIHIRESHHIGSIAETVLWLKSALSPPEKLWIDPSSQIWQVKEWMTLLAMAAALAMLLPLGAFLMGLPLFAGLRDEGGARYESTTGEFLKFSSINGALLWLYLPLILVLFGIHKYVVPIDGAFPMMMVNAKVWWFLVVNITGIVLLRRWYRARSAAGRVTHNDTGLSFGQDRFSLDPAALAKTVTLAVVLFLCLYFLEFWAEKGFIVNYRFLFPFMSDLTPYRVGMFFLYLPFILFCFIVTGVFLHGQLRRPPAATFMATFVKWSLYSAGALVVPLVLFLMVQYVPLFINGFIPFQGPNGLFVVFIINLIQVVAMLAFTSVISTWFYQLTGRVYAGALLNAFIVAWIFASSQVIAPIPV